MEAFKGLLMFWTLFSVLECFATIKVSMLGLAHNWALGDSVSITQLPKPQSLHVRTPGATTRHHIMAVHKFGKQVDNGSGHIWDLYTSSHIVLTFWFLLWGDTRCDAGACKMKVIGPPWNWLAHAEHIKYNWSGNNSFVELALIGYKKSFTSLVIGRRLWSRWLLRVHRLAWIVNNINIKHNHVWEHQT